MSAEYIVMVPFYVHHRQYIKIPEIRAAIDAVIEQCVFINGPDVMSELQKSLDSVGGMLIAKTFTRQQMDDLMAIVDCYVSLHRSEGFGLGIAESALLGKAVIATGYSGCMDYLGRDNSFLVDYELRPVVADDHRFRPSMIDFYRPGYLWAEPNVEQAAAHMQRIVDDPEQAQYRGAKAAERVAALCGRQAVGMLMKTRIRRGYVVKARNEVDAGD